MDDHSEGAGRDAAPLAALAAPGPFFRLRTGTPPGDAVPLASVHDGRDPEPLRARMERVGAQLGTTAEPRVAASLVHQALASRLWSVSIAALLLVGRLPRLDGDRLWWSPSRSVPDELWLPAPPAWSAPVPGPAPLWRAVWGDHLRPLAEAVRGITPVSARLLRSNTASAVAGAGTQLAGWARRGQAPPGTARRAQEVTGALLERPELAQEGTWDGSRYRRRGCCLYYRVPGGGVCGDCVFA